MLYTRCELSFTTPIIQSVLTTPTSRDDGVPDQVVPTSSISKQLTTSTALSASSTPSLSFLPAGPATATSFSSSSGALVLESNVPSDTAYSGAVDSLASPFASSSSSIARQPLPNGGNTHGRGGKDISRTVVPAVVVPASLVALTALFVARYRLSRKRQRKAAGWQTRYNGDAPAFPDESKGVVTHFIS